MRESEQARREAFETFYRRHYSQVDAYVRRRAHEAIIADVVAETFLTAWRRFEEARRGGLPWLYRTARLTMLNEQRSQRRQEHVASRIMMLRPSIDEGPEGRFGDRSLILNQLGKLSPSDRELLFLIYWEQVDLKTAAKVLNCATATAAVRLHRARRRLQNSVDTPPPAPTYAGHAASEVAR